MGDGSIDFDVLRSMTKSKEEVEIEVNYSDATSYKGKFYSALVVKALRSENTRLKNKLAKMEKLHHRLQQPNTMVVQLDGDNWFFTLPDFVNLQESAAFFLDKNDWPTAKMLAKAHEDLLRKRAGE